MSPAEEQILRNQVAIMTMLSILVGPRDNETEADSMRRVAQSAKDTLALLTAECEQGRTVYGYPSSH